MAKLKLLLFFGTICFLNTLPNPSQAAEKDVTTSNPTTPYIVPIVFAYPKDLLGEHSKRDIAERAHTAVSNLSEVFANSNINATAHFMGLYQYEGPATQSRKSSTRKRFLFQNNNVINGISDHVKVFFCNIIEEYEGDVQPRGAARSIPGSDMSIRFSNLETNTFTHEMGHLFGARHEPEKAYSGPTPFRNGNKSHTYNYAKILEPGSTPTVSLMYSSRGTSRVLNKFSDDPAKFWYPNERGSIISADNKSKVLKTLSRLYRVPFTYLASHDGCSLNKSGLKDCYSFATKGSVVDGSSVVKLTAGQKVVSHNGWTYNRSGEKDYFTSCLSGSKIDGANVRILEPGQKIVSYNGWTYNKSGEKDYFTSCRENNRVDDSNVIILERGEKIVSHNGWIQNADGHKEYFTSCAENSRVNDEDVLKLKPGERVVSFYGAGYEYCGNTDPLDHRNVVLLKKGDSIRREPAGRYGEYNFYHVKANGDSNFLREGKIFSTSKQ